METVPSMLFFCAVVIQSVLSSTIQLNKSADIILENTTLTLTCSKSDGTLQDSRWKISKLPNDEALCFFKDNKCTKTLFLSNNSFYDCTCNGNGTYSVILRRVNRSLNGVIWSCRETALPKSNDVMVKVAVPVTQAMLYQPDKSSIIENTNATFQCNTSYGLPQATIHWYRSKGSSKVELSNTLDGDKHITRTHYERDDKVISVVETLTYTVNRSVNGWSVYCEASNWRHQQVTSDRIELSVIYPPDRPPVIHYFTNGSIYKIVENSPASISCTVEGGNPWAKLKWVCLNLTNNKSVEIAHNAKVTSNLTWTAKRDQEKICRCQTDHILSNSFTFVNVDVLYPPAVITVQLQYQNNTNNVTEDVKLIENKTYSLKCIADGNPPPKKFTLSGPHGLTVSSTLSLSSVQRAESGTYSCLAQNIMSPTHGENKTGNRSTSVKVHILYKPTVAKLMNCDVIEGSSLNITCKVRSSNPNITDVVWTRDKMNLENYSNPLILRDISRHDSMNYTCTMKNKMIPTVGEVEEGQGSAMFYLNVLYPPAVLTVQLQNQNNRANVTTDIKLIESKTYSLNCNADGNTPRIEFTWSGPHGLTISSNASLDLSNVQRTENGTYSCVAQYIMIPTNGKTETGNMTTSVPVNILYKPTVAKLMNHDVVEGSSLNITCKVGSSNPNITDVVWTRDKMNWENYSNPLILRDISRHDSMNYTCTMKNKMIPTVGEKEEGQGSENLNLNVLYRASVRKFVIPGHENENPVIINNTTTIQFNCEIDSNPGSTTTIISPNGKEMWSADSNNMSYSHVLSSCLDRGNYTCTGINKYNHGRPGNASLSLLFNCKPIAKSPVKEDIRSALYVPVTLQFTAIAYPEPEFTWLIWTNSSWSILENDTMFSILSADMNSNLTVKNFTSTQTMQIRLLVENFMGRLTQNYKLQLLDRPDKPLDFSQVESYLTDTTVMLSWRPGFNGGLPQNFTLMHRRETDQEWNISVFPDTGQDLMNYTIRGLHSSTVYVFRIYAENMRNRSDMLEIKVTTKAAAVVEKNPESNMLVGLVVGSLSGVLVISGGAVCGILFYRKRHTIKKKTETGRLLYQNVQFSSTKKSQNAKTPTKKETSFQPLQELDDTPPEYNEPTEYYNSPEKIEQMEKIRVPELLQYVSDRTEEVFAAEYQKLPTGLQKPCTFARKPENIAMNRYNGIYPYDHSRVKIPGQPDFFINACYIHGYARQNAYIASLGPTKKVTNNYRTFWMMVWSEQSDIIVMLTNLQEPSGMKCEKYWPDFGTSIMCGDIQVTCDREDVHAEYTARSLTVSNAHKQRSVTHLHYTAWPDKKVPEDVTTLIEFRERIKATPSTRKGPMIVHCSAGIGRTGTLIALDRLIEEGQWESTVDVFKCVDDMREQRVKMVQTQEQYIYIYKALVHRLYFDCETIPVESFQEYVSTTNNNIYSKQFQQLKESVETCSKEERDARAANQLLVHKNRRGADIPGDQNRVRMYLNRQTDESDYINAVYVHSFKKKDHFISAQSPLPETVSDFIYMLYQENCCCIVTMEDLQEPGLAVGRYLPSGGRTLKIGGFEVSCTTLETKAPYTVREMKIKHSGQSESGEKAVFHFQYNKWVPGSDVPSDPKEFMQFIQDVEDYSDQLGEENSHVLVHCLKANERSGLYCIVTILMEKIRYERQVSILNTVRHFRTRRRTALTSMEQLKFCYKAVSAYINMNES